MVQREVSFKDFTLNGSQDIGDQLIGEGECQGFSLEETGSNTVIVLCADRTVSAGAGAELEKSCPCELQ